MIHLDAAVAGSQLRSAAKLVYYAAFAAAYSLAGAAADLVRLLHLKFISPNQMKQKKSSIHCSRLTIHQGDVFVISFPRENHFSNSAATSNYE